VIDGAVAAAANNYCGSCQVTFSTYNFSVKEPPSTPEPHPD